MQYLDKLKKERPLDRVIFLAGMVLAFIGFLIPTIYVKQIVTEVDLTAENSAEATTVAITESNDDIDEIADLTSEDEEINSEADEEADSELEEDIDSEAEESEAETDDYALAADDLEEDEEEDVEREFAYFASVKQIITDYKKNMKKDAYGNYEMENGKPKANLVLDKTGNKIITKSVKYNYVVVDAEVAEDDSGENVFVLEDGKPKYTYVLNFDKNGKEFEDDEYEHISVADVEKDYKISKNHFNLFGAVDVLNQAGVDYGDVDYIPGTAYNATFLVIVWLCTIAGIILFFLSKSIIGDVIVVLIAIAFGLASAFCIPLTLNVSPIVGYFSAGGYFVLIGIIVALAGTILGAAHIKHPSQITVAK